MWKKKGSAYTSMYEYVSKSPLIFFKKYSSICSSAIQNNLGHILAPSNLYTNHPMDILKTVFSLKSHNIRTNVRMLVDTDDCIYKSDDIVEDSSLQKRFIIRDVICAHTSISKHT